jgi:hypothetical protein
MEVTPIAVNRDWMNDTVFHSVAWRWGSGAPDPSLISDGGDAAHGITPKGQMPFLITGLLLARNVSLTANWTSDLKTTYDHQTSGGASVGWGPFSFGGHYVKTEHSDYRKADVSGNTISSADPQVIGFFVEVLPLSPNRSPTLNFPKQIVSPPAEPGALLGGVRTMSVTGDIENTQIFAGEQDYFLKHANQVLARAKSSATAK